MSEYCEKCGHVEDCCVCDDVARDNYIRESLEDYQDTHGLTNAEMTDFIRDNNIY